VQEDNGWATSSTLYIYSHETEGNLVRARRLEEPPTNGSFGGRGAMARIAAYWLSILVPIFASAGSPRPAVTRRMKAKRLSNSDFLDEFEVRVANHHRLHARALEANLEFLVHVRAGRRKNDPHAEDRMAHPHAGLNRRIAVH
jgi:hypothetical protein